LLTVGDYMRQHFLIASQEQRSMLAEHLKKIEASPVTSTKSWPPKSWPPTGPVIPAPSVAHQPRRPSAFRTIALGLVLGAGATAGTLYAINFRRPVHIHVLPSGKTIPTAAEEAEVDNRDEAAVLTIPTVAPGVATGLAGPGAAVPDPAHPVAEAATAPVRAEPGVTLTAANNSASKPIRDSQAHRSRRKVSKVTPRRLRTSDVENPTPTGSTHLSVPLFTRWQ
jgi:hypothetical protein